MNVFGGGACVDVKELAVHRGLDSARFDNLLMKEKTVALPDEDPVTFGVNAARPLLEGLSEGERGRIEMVIACTESAFDFGKSLSTYLHDYLSLSRNCRLFELKQACYAGTAGLQMAVNFVLSQTSPGGKVLVVATDVSRFAAAGEGGGEDWAFVEPSSGAGAVAMLVGESPEVFQIDAGASGYYGYEVMDTCRPLPEGGAGDADLSLLSYLDCCEHTFLEYQKRVEGADYRETFGYLAYHTPFGGMVKGAHRNMMRKLAKAGPEEIEEDFVRRVAPGLHYCQRVGNIMGATAALALASTIDRADLEAPQRIGCFSYGSGCCAEFYSGVATSEGQRRQRRFGIEAQLEGRHRLSVEEYEQVLARSGAVKFGVRNVRLEHGLVPAVSASRAPFGRLVLDEIEEFHRKYIWQS
ncbi:MAG: Polyketide biosynthesis 3-hydroxy-3-methylglutaryl-ACP synthase PksG [Verrucomicrobia subdivision 3 bacterium]|nr:Polyketide biosynthesis 3-hydroxy-3-methylglutaryl-ACP synthase PksG [Limisphaerales bacterium]